jgi:holo-[acyl-carrier protein] synthase
MVIGLGFDLVEVERVARMLARNGGRITARILTADEEEYCAKMHAPAVHVAARVAAKEATFKALAGTFDARAIGWREIEVSHDEHHRPVLALHGRAAARAHELGVGRVLLSMSHTERTAGAVVVLESSG